MGFVKWLIALFTAGIGALGIWEFGRLAKIGKKKGLSELSIAIGFLVMIGFFLLDIRSFFFSSSLYLNLFWSHLYFSFIISIKFLAQSDPLRKIFLGFVMSQFL